jgi:predicted nucleotide-binding protein
MADKFELISSLKVQASELGLRNRDQLDALTRRTEMIIRNVFGPNSKYLADLKNISFYPGVYPATDESYVSRWQGGARQLINLIQTMEEELKLFQITEHQRAREPSIQSVSEGVQLGAGEQSTRVFLVHGHDDGMKQNVARTLSKLGLDPIILHEKPNQGRTIIEKFTEYSNVSFAVVLLSPDDVGGSRSTAPADLKPRARQNVILELGYFLGRLGRARVVALYRQSEGFEMPSDYSGVLFVPYDDAGRWQFDLLKELKTSGYAVDANKLL